MDKKTENFFDAILEEPQFDYKSLSTSGNPYLKKLKYFLHKLSIHQIKLNLSFNKKNNLIPLVAESILPMKIESKKAEDAQKDAL